jgi:septal ring factor EnvC (AmiA/AmiB activator)
MCVDKRKHLLDEIEDLLEKQIELAQQGNISDVEVLGEQAGSLVEKIVQAGILGLPEFKNRRDRIQKLYKDLCLAITDQKADVSEKLSLVRKGRKTIEAYRSNI